MVLPKSESKWGTIVTSNNNHFLISYDYHKKKFMLYQICNGKGFKLCSSSEATELIKKIQNYENRN